MSYRIIFKFYLFLIMHEVKKKGIRPGEFISSLSRSIYNCGIFLESHCINLTFIHFLCIGFQHLIKFNKNLTIFYVIVLI